MCNVYIVKVFVTKDNPTERSDINNTMRTSIRSRNVIMTVFYERGWRDVPQEYLEKCRLKIRRPLLKNLRCTQRSEKY